MVRGLIHIIDELVRSVLGLISAMLILAVPAVIGYTIHYLLTH